MTEADWNACTDPQPMLEFLVGKASDRKLRLFAVACCRRIHHLLSNEEMNLVALAEESIEGSANEADLMAAVQALSTEEDYYKYATTPAEYARTAAFNTCYKDSVGDVAGNASWALFLSNQPEIANWNDVSACQRGWQVEKLPQACFLHDILGSIPFRPLTLNPGWLTPTVKQLAEAIYEERAFDQMPILGDALEESGCSNAEILNHCRGPGEHAKGCWVVDLLLGKE